MMSPPANECEIEGWTFVPRKVARRTVWFIYRGADRAVYIAMISARLTGGYVVTGTGFASDVHLTWDSAARCFLDRQGGCHGPR
jgi:hypothetical protein